jgi:hypothetical protein
VTRRSSPSLRGSPAGISPISATGTCVYGLRWMAGCSLQHVCAAVQEANWWNAVQVVEMRTGQEVEDSHKVVVTGPVRRVSEPVVRRMVPLCPAPPPFVQKSRFTVLTYNILADLYTTSKQFPMSEPFTLQWQYRRQVILKELALYDADIVCLQEVQSTSFHEDLKPEMDRRGFDAVFKKKTQVRSAALCMEETFARMHAYSQLPAQQQHRSLPSCCRPHTAQIQAHIVLVHGMVASCETSSCRCPVSRCSAIVVSCLHIRVSSLRGPRATHSEMFSNKLWPIDQKSTCSRRI